MQAISEEDYYQILGVGRKANEAEINKAYKKLAIKYHPDKNPEHKELAEENFKKVSEAYECLSSEEKRRTYDQFGKQGLNSNGMGGGGFSNERAEEIFSQFFGGQDPFSVLFGEGAAQHNGKLGVVQDFDEASSRYTIQLDSGDQLRIKYENLLQQLAAEVTGMQRAEFNGKTAHVSDWDEGKGRYHVKLQGEEGMAALQPQNLILPEGTRAKVVGLQSAPRWNARVGKITGFDRSKRRYTIQMTDEQHLSVKLENLVL